MTDGVGLLGGGAQADEIESYLNSHTNVLFRAVSKEYLSSTSGLVDIDSPEHYSSSKVVVAVGAPALRRAMVQKWSGSEYATVIADKSAIDQNTRYGQGCVFAPGVVVTTNVEFGEHVLVNVGATISHDCKIGSFSVISPGAHIAGKVDLGEGVFVGIGAIISNNVKIASGCVIGAGAVVLDDIETENSVVVGIPANIIKVNEGWLSEV